MKAKLRAFLSDEDKSHDHRTTVTALNIRITYAVEAFSCHIDLGQWAWSVKTADSEHHTVALTVLNLI